MNYIVHHMMDSRMSNPDYRQIIIELGKLYGSDRDAYNLALRLMHSVDGSAYIAG
jgi:hypothetical protein